MGRKTLKQLYEEKDKKKEMLKKGVSPKREQLIGIEITILNNKIGNETDKLFDSIDDKLYTDDEIEAIADKIGSREIMSKKDIPQPKSKSKANKSLTIAQQNKIIRQIPDDTFTRKEIEQIIKHIRDGSMVDVEQMPNPTKKQPKVKLSDVVIDKKKK